jgi:hypothetical protein
MLTPEDALDPQQAVIDNFDGGRHQRRIKIFDEPHA